MNIKLMTKEELAVRLEDFCDLFRQCFTADISKDIVKYRYLENPYSDLLMLIAEDKGRIVANYSAVPVKIWIDGKKSKAALSLNTMTHPRYAGKGLFVHLANSLNQYLSEQAYSLIYGFPNHLSNSIFTERIQWKNVYEIPTLEFAVDQISTNNLKDLSGKVESLDCWDGLEYVAERKVEIYKESCYLKWRYQEHPTNHYHVVKFSHRCWAVYHIYQDEVNITEMHHGENERDIKMILDYMIDFAVRNHLKKVTTWSPVNTEEHAVLEFYGFQNQTPIRYFALKVLNYSGNTDLYDHRNWKVHMGDDNVY